jgi:epoxyqueuosine reductase
MSKEDWKEITEEVFAAAFKNSAIKRTKFEGIKRNISFIESSEVDTTNITDELSKK